MVVLENDFIASVKDNYPKSASKIIEAYEFALAAHENIKRKSGEPYIVHPLSVAKILIDYESKKFKSVSEEDFSASNDVEKQELDKKAEENKDLLTAIKDCLDGKVKEVRLTANFKNYPVCLTAAGDVSIEMEKVFNSMPNADGKMKAEKILEISSEHGILDTLC